MFSWYFRRLLRILRRDDDHLEQLITDSPRPPRRQPNLRAADSVKIQANGVRNYVTYMWERVGTENIFIDGAWSDWEIGNGSSLCRVSGRNHIGWRDPHVSWTCERNTFNLIWKWPCVELCTYMTDLSLLYIWRFTDVGGFSGIDESKSDPRARRQLASWWHAAARAKSPWVARRLKKPYSKGISFHSS